MAEEGSEESWTNLWVPKLCIIPAARVWSFKTQESLQCEGHAMPSTPSKLHTLLVSSSLRVSSPLPMAGGVSKDK